MADKYGAWGYTPDWALLSEPSCTYTVGVDPIDPVSSNDDDSSTVVTLGGFLTGESTLLARALAAHPCPPDDKYNFHFDPKIWAVLLRDRLKGKNVLLTGPSGCGKCLAKGTQILMHDLSSKAVEDVVVGDLLMGPDGTPRYVESLARGQETMYHVAQNQCNGLRGEQ